MLRIFATGGQPAQHAVLAALFEARKRVFVDLFGWHVPVVAGRHEIDQFHGRHARHLVLTDAQACIIPALLVCLSPHS